MGDDNRDLFEKLPQAFRQKFTQDVLSRTSPADVVRISLVSKSFQSAANSDVVWDTFIPPHHRKLVLDRYYKSTFESSKDVFLFLCEHIAESHTDPLKFWLDKWSGKMWLKMTYENLSITQLATDYWTRSKEQYPVLGHVIWLQVYGKIPTSRLSPETAYEAYLVFRLSDYICYGLHIPIEASVGIPGEEITKELIYLDPRIAKSGSFNYYPNTYPGEGNPLIEVKMGEYFNKEGENRDVEVTLKEVKSGRPKCGVHIAGMKMLPKRNINL
ncbi:F-box protein PP2-B10 isoform X1 [Daucus carota subsp. sativus]|uniref:F-box protein PP2-B10 isoform X1 n=1 Tax=Daucus carota subsp. sativus TaxID=79200 RepID=UPI0007F03C0A|nr:PREDICTED: F-box protein PP2-B10-like isoform X1 [Daucus carota subsp. sativus]